MSRRALGRGLDALIPDRSGSSLEESTIAVPGHETRVPLEEISPNPFQPRSHFDRTRLEELVQSIREKGLVQPILLRPHGEKYQIVAGERRFRAAKEAGLESVPAVIRDIADAEVLEIALVENLQREDLNPVDEAEAYQLLNARFGLTQAEIAQKVGKDRSSVANTMRLLKLPGEIRKSVSRGTLSMGHARALLGLGSEQQQTALAREIEARGLSVRDTERRIRQIQRAERGKSPRPVRGARSPEVASLEETMQRWLGTKVRIAGRTGKGRLVVEFYSLDDLERIVDIFRSGPNLP